MQVIGAGLPRTATTTQMVALEQLGLDPCYHMRNLLADLRTGLPLWESVAAGDPDWEEIFGDARSTVDWPSARYYRDLMDHYPDAKVLLSVRDGASWVRSMRQTVWGIFHGDSVIHHVSDARAVIDPLWSRYTTLMNRITWDEPTGALAGDTSTDEGLIAVMDRWNDAVKATVPAERLLVWFPTDGWEPLCNFLEVDVPGEPVPSLNDTASFREGIIGGGLGALNDWWEQREPEQRAARGRAVSRRQTV
jgi:Sulfotransferase domain